jgi:hypothetical protein
MLEAFFFIYNSFVGFYVLQHGIGHIILDFQALVVEENLRCLSIHYFRQETGT